MSKISENKMAEKVSLEKNMSIIVKSFKELKVCMDVSNAEAIKQINIEFKRLEKKNEAAKVDSKKDEDDTRCIKAKKCKYFNRCYCKYKFKCKFVHPGESYKIYLEGK